jgi:DNA-binding MarR family transcriptional regulator
MSRIATEAEWRTAMIMGGDRIGGGNDDASDAVAQLHRAANAVRQHVEQMVLRPESLTWTGFSVLRAVLEANRLETRQAAEQAGIAKGTLTGVVDTLVARGLVRRVDHPEDRRLVLLELTRTGHRLVRQLLPAVQREEAFALGALPAGEMRRMSAALGRLIAHLDSSDAKLRRN